MKYKTEIPPPFPSVKKQQNTKNKEIKNFKTRKKHLKKRKPKGKKEEENSK